MCDRSFVSSHNDYKYSWSRLIICRYINIIKIKLIKCDYRGNKW